MFSLVGVYLLPDSVEGLYYAFLHLGNEVLGDADACVGVLRVYVVLKLFK